MSENQVDHRHERGVHRLTLNRPQKRNALTRQLLLELETAVAGIAGDESARLVVLSANGPVFCAGMDLGEMQQRAQAPDASEQWLEDSRVYRRLVGKLVDLPVPTIAVVQGPAVAGGCGLVLACDLALAAEEAFLALPEPQRGITAAMVVPLLCFRGGGSAASSLLLSGERISGAAAFRAGLFHDCVAAADLPARTERLIGAVLTGAPQALRVSKQHLRDCAASWLHQWLDRSVSVSAEARQTDDAREGLAAFLEKRTPNWVPDVANESGGC